MGATRASPHATGHPYHHALSITILPSPSRVTFHTDTHHEPSASPAGYPTTNPHMHTPARASVLRASWRAAAALHVTFCVATVPYPASVLPLLMAILNTELNGMKPN